MEHQRLTNKEVKKKTEIRFSVISVPMERYPTRISPPTCT